MQVEVCKECSIGWRGWDDRPNAGVECNRPATRRCTKRRIGIEKLIGNLFGKTLIRGSFGYKACRYMQAEK